MLKPRNILIVAILMIVIFVNPFGLATTLDPFLKSAWLLGAWILGAIWLVTLPARRRAEKDAPTHPDASDDEDPPTGGR